MTRRPLTLSRGNKLLLDIVMGAVIPILVLNYLTEPLGAPTAYLLSGLVPVAWIAIDLLLLTRQFNFITAYIGIGAIVRSILAFWFVDGWRFALKDSAGLAVATVIFAVTLVRGRPMLQHFLHQAIGPDTAEREAIFASACRHAAVAGALRRGTWMLLLVNAASTLANVWLNLAIVVAPFGTTAFNLQVAEVNAITRIAFVVPDLIAFGIAFVGIYRAVFAGQPIGAEALEDEDGLWRALAARVGT
jgi:hypothetical protein